MRLFVALDLPHATRQRLADLAVGVPDARWVAPENMHLTLRFIGEIPRYQAEELDLALAALQGRGFELILSGVGTRDVGGFVVSLWVGVERNAALAHLRAKIDRALQSAGLPPERRRFVPHVTLARLDKVAEPRLAAWVQAHNLFRSEPVWVRHFTLFSSVLGHDEAVYTPEVEYALR